MLHGLDIKHGADGVHYVLQFGGLGEIRKIKSFEDALFEFFALRRIVGSHENSVGGNRTPEGLGFEGDDLQSVFERDAVQFHTNGAGGVVGIEQNFVIPH